MPVDSIVPLAVTVPVTFKVVPLNVKFASPFNVVPPSPVIILFDALLFIVVPVTVLQVAALLDPPLVSTCPDVP